MTERNAPVAHLYPDIEGPYKGPMTVDASLLHALWCYGALSPVTGVVYSYGSHQKSLDDADRLLCDRAQQLAAAKAASSSDGGGESRPAKRDQPDLRNPTGESGSRLVGISPDCPAGVAPGPSEATMFAALMDIRLIANSAGNPRTMIARIFDIATRAARGEYGTVVGLVEAMDKARLDAAYEVYLATDGNTYESLEAAILSYVNTPQGCCPVVQGAGNSGEPAQPASGPMRMDLMLEKVDAENAQNSEAFNDMRAHIWAAGASHEDADFITRMLTRKGLYLFQTEPWKRCPSTHCERRGECAGPRDCTVKRPSPSVPSTHECSLQEAATRLNNELTAQNIQRDKFCIGIGANELHVYIQLPRVNCRADRIGGWDVVWHFNVGPAVALSSTQSGGGK